MINLRPYQAECVDSVFRSFAEHHSALAVLATGLGKTVIGSAVIGRWIQIDRRGRVLWLAHREELIDQAAEAIHGITGERVAVEMGDRYSDEGGLYPASVVLASVQTLSRLRRLKRFAPERFSLIVTDEAHHSVANSYRKVYRYFREGCKTLGIEGNPAVRHLGITATPKRSDDLAMGRVFDTVAFDYGIAPAVNDGWLVPVQQATAIVGELDLSRVKIVNGDYSPSQLEAMLTDPETKIVLKMTRPIIEHSGDKQTIVFTVGKNQARLMAEALNNAKPDSAVFVTDETPKDQRRKIMADFRAGRVQYFCNCGIATEGFDAVAVALVAIARPTKSITLYAQMLGRATRPLKGVVDGPADAAARKAAIALSSKPHATVLDFVGNVDRLGAAATVSAADILGGDYSADVREYAKHKMGDSGNPQAVDEALERADAELALLREEEERKARIVADVDYRVRYLHTQADAPLRQHEAGKRGEPATEKQVWKLVRLGVPRHKAEACTKAQARGWIGRLLGEDR